MWYNYMFLITGNKLELFVYSYMGGGGGFI